MIDIHSHILTCKGDDGSNSMENTFSMVLSAQRQGVTAMFATPHSEAFSRRDVFLRFDIMKRMLQSVFPDMGFYLGSEVMCAPTDMGEILRALESEKLATMNDSRYVLVEFDAEVQQDSVDDCLSKLLDAKFFPILAHWERYVNLHNRLDYIRKLRQLGCLVQVNVYSLEEHGDERIRDWARTLIGQKLVDFLGTDCHKTWFRPPSIQQGMDWLKEHCRDREYLDAIIFKNADELLIKKEGEHIC